MVVITTNPPPKGGTRLKVARVSSAANDLGESSYRDAEGPGARDLPEPRFAA
jgi:hypothetical protein